MKYAFVAIGASLGGLQAVKAVLSVLPATFRLPLALVQHRVADAGDELALALRAACALPVREAEDKSAIEPGTVFIAPPGYHLMVEDGHFALTTEDPVGWARPSIDVLFETAAESFGPRVIGIVLSGTGEDGAKGLAVIRRHGGAAIVQAPETAFADGMPRAAARAVGDQTALPLEAIGTHLLDLSLKE